MGFSIINGACLAMAGVGRPADEQRVRHFVSTIQILSGVSVLIYNDAVAALASGTGGKLNGVVVIRYLWYYVNQYIVTIGNYCVLCMILVQWNWYYHVFDV